MLLYIINTFEEDLLEYTLRRYIQINGNRISQYILIVINYVIYIKKKYRQ
jgi:hypothetical protein